MPKSNIGRVLEKISDSQSTRSGGEKTVIKRRHMEYEDGVIARSEESREQIRRMVQPLTFSQDDMAQHQFISGNDENEILHSLIKDLRNKITFFKTGLASSVLVTSIGETDQSSLIAQNLAAMIASDESRTSLLLELWNTGSKLHSADAENNGLSDFIENDDLQIGDIILPTGIRRMRVIPFSSSEYLNYEYLRATRLRILIKDITRRYPRDRFTVFNAPPIDKVSDVELLSEYADQILVCIPYGKMSQAQIRKGLAKLDRTKLMGTILCGAPRMEGLVSNFAK